MNEFKITLLQQYDQFVAKQDRSTKWAKFSKDIIKKNPVCSACDDIKDLEVHHILPFHLYPELELVEDNCIVLCRMHHFVIGHSTVSWSGYNIKVIRDSVRYKASLHRNYKTTRKDNPI